MGYTCGCCGKYLDELPLCFAAEAPWRQLGVENGQFEAKVAMQDDVCVVQTDRFIYLVRGHIRLPIQGTEDIFLWSAWSSLSEASFRHAMDRWSSGDRAGDEYFGWLCSNLPTYGESTWALKADVVSREIGVVPIIHIQECDHPLYREQEQGISVARWHEIVHQLLHGASES